MAEEKNDKINLSEVKGIGKKKALELEEAGIDCAQDLVSKDVKEISNKLGSAEDTIKKYQKRAEELIKDYEGLEEKGKGDSLEEKKKELEEKAKELASRVEGEEDIKDKFEELGKGREFLVPIKDYLKTGAYIGTKVITPHMKKYVYKRRNDGIANIDTNEIDKKIKEAVKELAKYDPSEFIVVCKREAGWEAVEKFGELLGVRIFTKKYPAGILTNPKLPGFFETKMVFVCDPWVDKNAMNDAKRVKSKVFGLCDTNNYTFKVDHIIPINNKSDKSLNLVFYVLAREYFKERGENIDVKKEDFIPEEYDEE